MVKRKRSREARAGNADAPRSVGNLPTVPRGRADIATDDDARALALRLLTPGRRWPVAVITVANGEREPFADVDELVDALRDLAEVIVMPTSDVSWAFSAVMPNQTQVYGGASRVYPVDHEWVNAPRRAPLRFAYSARERARVTEQLIGDGMSAAVAAGLYRPQQSSSQRQASGAVLGLVGSRALVRLDDGSMATLWEELSGFDVPLARLVQPGQRLDGVVDLETRRLDLERPQGRPDEARRLPPEYAVGDAVLAEVTQSDASNLMLRPAYGLDVDVDRSLVSTNENDRLDVLFSPGDVVVARIIGVSPVSLSMLDVDDDEAPRPAPAILVGGPPWLVTPVRPEIVEIVEITDDTAIERMAASPSGDVDTADPDDVLPTPAAPIRAAPRSPTPLDVRAGSVGAPVVAAPSPPVASVPSAGAVRDLALTVEAERSKVARLERELADARGATHELVRMREYASSLAKELDASEQNRLAFRDKYRAADRTRQQLERKVKASAAVEPDVDSRGWFIDPEDALRFSVNAAWAARVPAGEKENWPIGAWLVGPQFVDSLSNLGQISWRRLVEVICDVVVGDPARLSALEHHELRRSESGNSPAVTRGDGAVCYRVALQRNAPSARRLHYWRRGSVIELSRVVLHDDTSP